MIFQKYLVNKTEHVQTSKPWAKATIRRFKNLKLQNCISWNFMDHDFGWTISWNFMDHDFGWTLVYEISWTMIFDILCLWNFMDHDSGKTNKNSSPRTVTALRCSRLKMCTTLLTFPIFKRLHPATNIVFLEVYFHKIAISHATWLWFS